MPLAGSAHYSPRRNISTRTLSVCVANFKPRLEDYPLETPPKTGRVAARRRKGREKGKRERRGGELTADFADGADGRGKWRLMSKVMDLKKKPARIAGIRAGLSFQIVVVRSESIIAGV